MGIQISLIFFLFSVSFVFSQKAELFCPEAIPISETGSVDDIANYINIHHKTQKERITAIYCWIGNNIRYDVVKATSLTHFSSEKYDKEKAIQNTLSIRKGICQDYAELMEALCRKCEIDAWFIPGIVRKQETIGEPHAWVIAQIDTLWHIYDPTWGAGYVNDNTFTQHFTFDFYDIPTETAITSHLPFDLMWQLLQHPITVESFYNGKFIEQSSFPLFNYTDTIATFKQQDSIQQCYDVIRRIEENGIYNQPTVDYLVYLQTIINNGKVTTFNVGVSHFNAAVAASNEFANYYNRQFSPEKSRADIEYMLSIVETNIKDAMQQFSSIKDSSPDMMKSINDLIAKMQTITQKATEQKQFVKKYFDTAPEQRKMLFYTTNK